MHVRRCLLPIRDRVTSNDDERQAGMCEPRRARQATARKGEERGRWLEYMTFGRPAAVFCLLSSSLTFLPTARPPVPARPWAFPSEPPSHPSIPISLAYATACLEQQSTPQRNAEGQHPQRSNGETGTELTPDVT